MGVQWVSAGIAAFHAFSFPLMIQGNWKSPTCKAVSFASDGATSLYVSQSVHFSKDRFRMDVFYYSDAQCQKLSASEGFYGTYHSDQIGENEFGIHFNLENASGTRMPDIAVQLADSKMFLGASDYLVRDLNSSKL